MKRAPIFLYLVIFLSFVSFCELSLAQDLEPVVIDYFYEPGCPDCMKVKNQVMPELEERFETFYVLNKYDLGVKTNIFRLVAYQKQLGIKDNEPVSMVVGYQHVLNGFPAIKKGLFDRIDLSVAERMEEGWKASEPIISPPSAQEGLALAEGRIEGFTAVAVVFAGLSDGINPCAIATLIFFMSMLSVAKIRGRGLLLVGVPFCLASFLTYTALGFGLLRVLHLLEGFDTVRTAIEWGLLVLLALFAFLSFRDAYRYKKTGKPGDVTLQLPVGIKKRIHKIIHEGVRAKSLVLAGFTIGVLVTALESVCTGQMYVPTLALMIKEDRGTSRIWSYLLTYNLMFITPLVIVFIMVYFGLKTESLVNWSRKNVVVSKVMLGCLFVVLAFLMAAL